MKRDRLMMMLALVLFAGFMGIIAARVGHTDLTILAIIGVAFATVDILLQWRAGRSG